jgi:hypothetical protein
MLGDVDDVLTHADDLLGRDTVTPQLQAGIAEALRLHGRADRALELLAEPQDDELTTSADTEVRVATQIECHLTRGDLPAALGLIREHLPPGGRTSSPALRRAGARAQLLAGRPRAASALVAVPFASQRGPVAAHVDAARAATLAQVHARLGDHEVTARRVEEALAGIDGLVGQLRWSVTVAAADALTDLGRHDDALALVMAEVDDAAAAGAVVTVAELLALAAGAGHAQQVLPRLERAVETIDGPLWPVRLSEVRTRVAGGEHDAMARIAADYRVLGANGLAARIEGSDALDGVEAR